MGQAIFTKLMNTPSDLTEVEDAELSSDSGEQNSEGNIGVSLAKHLKQVTTPDHNLLDYHLCVDTAHALRNYQHTHWSEPVWPAVYTCTPMDLKA